MTRVSTTSDVLRFGFTRLAHAVGVAISVVLLLFMILESGFGGDPALRLAGQHSAPERIAEARLHLGYFKDWQAGVLNLQLEGPAARFYLQALQPEVLQVLDVQNRLLQELPLADLNLRQLQSSLNQLALSDEHRLYVSLAEGHAQQPALGVGHAMLGAKVAIQSNRSADLGWASPQPAWKRFVQQTSKLLLFDFGRSLDGQSIADELRSRGGRSLALTVPAFLIGTILALFAALLAANRLGKLDRGLSAICAFCMAITSLAWVLFLRYVFAAKLEWFPIAGWQSPYSVHLVLPILIWALLFFFPSFLLYRSIFLGQKAQDHFCAARARGLTGWRLLLNHMALPASASILSQLVLVLPFLVVGSLLLERIFVIPGLGSYIVNAAISGDAPILRSTTFLISLLYLASQWLGDWVSAAADPRTRAEVQHD
ncbi:MAG: ABC transporter permease [Planctomycetes bacterium]|nr:ABC transporter permease [Planctomycetota bacterium]